MPRGRLMPPAVTDIRGTPSADIIRTLLLPLPVTHFRPAVSMAMSKGFARGSDGGEVMVRADSGRPCGYSVTLGPPQTYP